MSTLKKGTKDKDPVQHPVLVPNKPLKESVAKKQWKMSRARFTDMKTGKGRR